MADVTEMISGLGTTADSAASTAYLVIKIIFVAAIIGLLVYWIWNKKQYRYGVKLKMLQNGKFVYYESVARLKRDDNNVNFWYIKGLRELVTIPPNESMTISATGRWIAEGYYDRITGVVWGKDLTTEKDFEKKLTEIVNSGKELKSGTNSIDVHHQPFTTTERSLLASRISRAMQRKGKDVWAMIWQLVPVVVLLIIFVLVVIFWNDIAKPVIALQGANAQISHDNSIMQQQNLRLYQMLTGGKGNGTYIVQQLPGDQQYFLPQYPGVNSS